MSFLNPGSDGLLLVMWLFLTAIVTFSCWRRWGAVSSGMWTFAVALAFVAFHFASAQPHTISHLVLLALLVCVPIAILLGLSRVDWFRQRAWVLLLVGPLVFFGCTWGICYCAFRVIGA